MTYTSDSRALCVTEIVVHAPAGVIPQDYVLLTFEVPSDTKILELEEKLLPNNWNAFPYHSSTQKLGDKFLKAGEYAVMKVPSAVVKGEFNYVLNPAHPDFKKIKVISIEPFDFDKRLFTR